MIIRVSALTITGTPCPKRDPAARSGRNDRSKTRSDVSKRSARIHHRRRAARRDGARQESALGQGLGAVTRCSIARRSSSRDAHVRRYPRLSRWIPLRLRHVRIALPALPRARHGAGALRQPQGHARSFPQEHQEGIQADTAEARDRRAGAREHPARRGRGHAQVSGANSPRGRRRALHRHCLRRRDPRPGQRACQCRNLSRAGERAQHVRVLYLQRETGPHPSRQVPEGGQALPGRDHRRLRPDHVSRGRLHDARLDARIRLDGRRDGRPRSIDGD